MDIDENFLLPHLKETVRNYMIERGFSMHRDGEELLEHFGISDFNFYVNYDGEIILCIPIYQLTAGAYNAHEVPTGLFMSG